MFAFTRMFFAVLAFAVAGIAPAQNLSPQQQLARDVYKELIEINTVMIRVMSTGATDGMFLRNAGIPVYGHSGLAVDISENRAHGKDERVLVKSFCQGNEYLYRLVKSLAK